MWRTHSTGESGNAFTFRAPLPPTAAGGGFCVVAKLVQRRSRDRDAAAVAAVTVTATATATAVLRNVSFGDVVLCLGQSNIWLPMSYDVDRHRTYASLAAGAYGHVRLFNHGFATPDTRGTGL